MTVCGRGVAENPDRHNTESGFLRKLTDTTAAPFFHVDPVIDQNSALMEEQEEEEEEEEAWVGACCSRRCAVQTGRRERAGRCGTEVLSRHEAVKAKPARVKASYSPHVHHVDREETMDANNPSRALPNPFGSGEEDRRLLQSYIQSSLKDGQGGPEISTWEQEVFFLFGLYDYDRSGLLDGLEMMKLLSDYSSHHTPGTQANELVVSMVDFLLQTQDLNQDGLLAPSELLSPPLPLTQDTGNNNAPHEEQEVAVEEKLSNPSADEERAGAAEQRQEVHEEIQKEEQPQHEVKTEQEEHIQQVVEHNGQELSEAPAAEQGVPIHQGQPEI
ncbi:hypothetical protein INR49_001440 [Caranx melampygus]|nr:hypothetical protein INR49_001440 [Caranx melampygus]